MIDALERVEIGLRAEIVNLLGQHGDMAHREANKLHGNLSSRPANKNDRRPGHQKWLSRPDHKFANSDAELVVRFKQENPGKKPPISIAAEIWDFGTAACR